MTHPSGKRIQSIRFSDAMWQDIQDEARMEGVSASQFVRESAFARVWWLRAHRGDRSSEEVERFLLAARATEHPDVD